LGKVRSQKTISKVGAIVLSMMVGVGAVAALSVPAKADGMYLNFGGRPDSRFGVYQGDRDGAREWRPRRDGQRGRDGGGRDWRRNDDGGGYRNWAPDGGQQWQRAPREWGQRGGGGRGRRQWQGGGW
jgi:hypothetical protein